MAEGLNLFSAPISDASIISRQDTDYYPSDSVPDNNKETITIEVINKSEVDFIDHSSKEILMKLQIRNKTNNAPLNSTMIAAKYGICNNFGHSIFKQITLQEGDIDMNTSTGTYPYQVDFENVITYDERDLEGRPRLEGYIPDTQTQASMQMTYSSNNDNAGLTVRSALFDNGNTVSTIIKPHLGPLAQGRYLLPKTRVQFRLIPNSDDFLLTYADDAEVTMYGVYIRNIKLRTRTVKLNPQVATQIYRNLQKRRAIYPTPVPLMTTALLENGVHSWEKDNGFSGKVPKLFMFGIVENAAFNGSRAKNPFYYRNLNINETRIYIDGVPVIPTLHTDFANHFQEGFLQILKATGEKRCLLNSQTWAIHNMWAFDLSPKGMNALHEFHSARSGNLRIELFFGAASAGSPFTIIMYGLMDSTSEIDSFNNVIRNW